MDRIRHLSVHFQLNPLLETVVQLKTRELLSNARKRIFDLESAELAAQANPRSVVEGDILPDLRIPVLPPLRPPLTRIWPARGSPLKRDDRVDWKSALIAYWPLKNRA